MQDATADFPSPSQSNAAVKVAEAFAERRENVVVYSTLSPETVRRVVAQSYDGAQPLGCVLYQRGGVNDIYLLSTTERKFALRVSRANTRGRDAVTEELSILETLGRLGVDVVKPKRRRDREFVTEIRAPEGIRHAVMFEWIGGNALKYTAEHALRLGRLVGKLHDVSDQLPPEAARPELGLETLLEAPLRIVQPRIAAMPQIAEPLAALAERVRSRYREAATGARDWGFCHGDIHSGNARIEGEAPMLFDFDSCGPGLRLYDLATYKLAAKREGAEYPAWDAFVEGYLQTRPGRVDSFEYLGLFMTLRYFWLMGQWMLLSADAGVSFLPDEFFENLVPFCEGIEADTGRPQRA